MAWDAAIGGGASTFGSIYGANKSAKSAKKVMQMQIAWERERAQNAHQWEVKDLEAAGLNPILSAGGQGAATSGVSGQMPDTSGYGQAGEALLNSAKAISDIENQNKITEAQTKNLEIDTLNKAEEGNYISKKAKAEIRQTISNTALNTAKSAETKANTLRTKGDPRTLLGKIAEDAENTAKKLDKLDKNKWKKGIFGIRYRSTKPDSYK